MRYCYYFLGLMLFALGFMACKKLSNDAFQEHPVITAPLSISVVNDDDQLPLAGIKVIISRKTTAKDNYTQVDTIRTNEKGEINTNLPYPNLLTHLQIFPYT